MTKEQYIKMTEALRKDEKRAKKIIGINQVLTGLVFVIYPLYLVALFFYKDPLLLRGILVPAASFGMVSLFRNLVNVKRPYEKFGIPPVLEKDTKGKSFPSRHVFSAFMIAMTVFVSHPGTGLLLFLVGSFIAVVRVLGGVHAPMDVIAGAGIGIVCGLLGYWPFFFR